jgi:hypothetical protein
MAFPAQYPVFVLTKPLNIAMLLSPLGKASATDCLRHWGVLVTEMSLIDAQAILARNRSYCGGDYTELGTMYELFQDEEGHNNVNIRCDFGLATIRKEWRGLTIHYIGQTEMSFEMIKQEGCISPSLPSSSNFQQCKSLRNTRRIMS